MTQHDTEHLLDQLAQTLPEGSVSLDSLLIRAKAADRRHLRRKRLAVAGVATTAVVLGATVPIALFYGDYGHEVEVATDGAADPSTGPATGDSSLAPVLSPDVLTPQQRAAARRVLQTYMDDNVAVQVETAWARWERGAVKQPDVGDCTSGELLRVNLFGSFPGIVTSGGVRLDDATAIDMLSTATATPDPLAGTVTEVRLIADAQTEEVCQLSVVTGTHGPDPRDQQIYPETLTQSPADDGSDGDSEISLDGTWRVTALVDSSGDLLLTGPFADQLEMTFTGGVMTGSSGCNDVRAVYEAEGRDLQFDASNMMSTTVGCEEPPLAERLLAVRHVSRDGDTVYLHAENWMIVVGLTRG